MTTPKTVEEAGAPPLTVPQLVRFRRRLEKSMDALENASWYALEALRVFDGDRLQIGKFPAAMAWETAHSAEAAIPALKALLAAALTDANDQLRALREAARTQTTGGGK